jgi:hypothetical protein
VSSCRLLRAIRVVAGVSDAFVVELNVDSSPTQQTLTVPAGVYYASGDGAADDLYAAMVAAITAGFSLPGAANIVHTIAVAGVSYVDSARAEGRVRLSLSASGASAGASLTYLGAAASWTLGYPGGGAQILGRGLGQNPSWIVTALTATPGAVYSDGPARTTWYPQLSPTDWLPEEGRWQESVDVEGSDATDGQSWGYYHEQEVRWEAHIPAALMLRSASVASDYQAVARLGSAPTWASWEAWCRDVQAARDAGLGEDVYRVYSPELTSTPTGPWRWPARFAGWSRPMAAARRTGPASYGLTVEGRAAQ